MSGRGLAAPHDGRLRIAQLEGQMLRARIAKVEARVKGLAR
jgi:hypothetical protein